MYVTICTSAGDERALECGDKLEVEREAPVAAVVHEDRVRAEAGRRHAVRVRALRLPAHLRAFEAQTTARQHKLVEYLTLGFPRFGSKELVPRWGHFRPHLKRASLIAPNCIYTLTYLI